MHIAHNNKKEVVCSRCWSVYLFFNFECFDVSKKLKSFYFMIELKYHLMVFCFDIPTNLHKVLFQINLNWVTCNFPNKYHQINKLLRIVLGWNNVTQPLIRQQQHQSISVAWKQQHCYSRVINMLTFFLFDDGSC